MKLTFKEFDKYITDMKSISELNNGFRELTTKFNKSSKEQCDIMFPSLFHNTVELLEKLTNDQYKYIDYFIYEIDFGRLDDKYGVTDYDGNKIPLKTTKDLWDVLNSEQNKS